MPRPVKCKICGKLNDINLAYKICKTSDKTGKVTNKYYCNQQEYKEFMRKKEELSVARTEALTFIHDEVLNYDDGKIIPPVLIKRLTELNKYYAWQVIRASFKIKYNEIKYALETKEFKNEYNAMKYILVIVESVINDVNGKWKYLQQQERSNEVIVNNIQSDVYEDMSKTEINVNKSNKKDISAFLEEEDD